MQETCDLCGSSELLPVYYPPTGTRGLTVYLCKSCGLVQSLPRIDSVPGRKVAVSSGAGWGNIRYGKGFRTDAALKILSSVLEFDTLESCLDIGSNRGSFVLKLADLAHQAIITSVEPDSEILQAYDKHSRIKIITNRIENVELPKDYFDLVYSSHTFEHLRSPAQTLRMIRHLIKPDGVLFLEVPNIEFISRDDVVEEWFIDKHLYHFSVGTFVDLVTISGFDLLPKTLTVNDSNITLVAKPSSVESAKSIRHGSESDRVEYVKGMIEKYKLTLVNNNKKLRTAARKIEELAKNKRVVIWGAGRILDGLIEEGNFKISCLVGLVDKHLAKYVSEKNGQSLLFPDQLSKINPDLVIIASREYFDEIRREINEMKVSCQIKSLFSFADLDLY